MQKRHVDSLLYSSIALLAFSILGFIYLLWQTYRMSAKQLPAKFSLGHRPVILIPSSMPTFQPMPLLKRAATFDDPQWIYELKIDGFSALAFVEDGRAHWVWPHGRPCS